MLAACRPVSTPFAAGFEAVEAYPLVGDEGVEDADGVGAAADAGADRVRQLAGQLQALLPRLDADPPGEVAHHGRERVRAGDRTEQVVGGLDVGDPVAQRLVDGVLEGTRAGGHRDHGGAEQPHPGDVERLPAGVLLAHVDHALEVVEGGGGGAGHAVLAGAGLGDHPLLAHPLGEQGLAEDVADLVRAGVVEVLALEQDPGARLRGEPGGIVEPGRQPGVVMQDPGEIGLERLVAHGPPVLPVELVQR